MTKRPIFIPSPSPQQLVKEELVSFDWNPGFAPIQKKKNILALHQAAALRGMKHLLEVSSKSDDQLGFRLSAFNLTITLDEGRLIPLECAFQGSKKFENGGPFTDLYNKDSLTAKRDSRLKSNGKILSFNFDGLPFPSEPKTAFYDWIYIKALMEIQESISGLLSYDGFTDIEFNPGKSINCQARSCALYVALVKQDLLTEALRTPQAFISTISPTALSQKYSDDVRQRELF